MKILQYFTGSVNKFAVLRDVGQISLAYLTAATHGFTEEASALKAELEAKGQSIPPVDPEAHMLAPPPPIKKVFMFKHNGRFLHKS